MTIYEGDIYPPTEVTWTNNTGVDVSVTLYTRGVGSTESEYCNEIITIVDTSGGQTYYGVVSGENTRTITVAAGYTLNVHCQDNAWAVDVKIYYE